MATIAMDHFRLRQTCLGLPTSKIALLCSALSVNAYLTAGDTVKVRGFEGDEFDAALSSFVGRIIEIEPSPRCRHEQWCHPNAKRGELNSLLLVQKFVTTDDCEDWPAVTPETALAASGIREAAESNLCIWVTMEDIEQTVFLIHEVDVLDQTFGNVAGRKNCFFVCLFVQFDVVGRFEFEPIH